MTREAFPQDYNDPFNQQNKDVSQKKQVDTFMSHKKASYKEIDASSWLSECNSPKEVGPKWRLQTAEERIEQENTVKKLESKLQKLKQRPDKHYSYKRKPDISPHLIETSESDCDQDDLIQEESQDEGLPLLWQQNQSPSSSPRETAKKTEDQYHHFNQRRIISCCFNC